MHFTKQIETKSMFKHKAQLLTAIQRHCNNQKYKAETKNAASKHECSIKKMTVRKSWHSSLQRNAKPSYQSQKTQLKMPSAYPNGNKDK